LYPLSGSINTKKATFFSLFHFTPHFSRNGSSIGDEGNDQIDENKHVDKMGDNSYNWRFLCDL